MAEAPVAAPTNNTGPGAVAVDNSKFGGPNAAQAAAANQAMLVTSSAARSTTANNVSNLQAATTPAPGTPGSATNAGPNAQVNTDTGTAAGHTININTGGGSSSSSSSGGGTGTGNGMYQYKLANGNTVSIGDPTLNRAMLSGATFVSGPNGNEADPLAGSGGGGTAGNPASGGGSTSGNTSADPTAGITDPALRAQYQQSLAGLDSATAQAYSNLEAARATVANDPAATAAVNAISAKYDQLISLMKAKNNQVIGQANNSVAAFGGLGVMSANFLNDQQSRADDRINTLVNQEQSLILQAQIAYQTKDMKGLNAAMTAYDTANKNKLNAINDLLTATNKQVTQMQAQQKIDMAAQKQQVTTDISKSANLGTSIAQNLKDSGITDPGQIDQYIQGIAQEYGISNPDILKSAVQKAQAATSKAALAAANTADTIANRDIRTGLAVNKANKPAGGTKPKTDGSFNYTADDTSYYSSIMQKGATTKDGTTYNPSGSDGYVDPGAYTASLQSWLSKGGTAAGFAKEFPPKKLVNPASYSQLPASIRPASKVTATAQPIPQ